MTPYQYVTTYKYNPSGQIVSIDGPRPGDMDRIRLSYDPDTGDLLEIEQPHGLTTTWSDYDGAGNPGRMIDANGIESLLEYDGRNRLVSTTREGVTFSTVYNLRGKPEYVIDGAGRRLDFVYSPEGYLERVVDPGGNYRYYAHDANGSVTEESIFTASGSRRYWIRYAYGDLQAGGHYPGKPWKVIGRSPDDTADIEAVYSYDAMGNVVSYTDGAGNQVTYIYDAFNRLECEQHPGDIATEYGYDHHGNLVSIRDPGGLVTSYVYDDMGRLVQVDSPDSGLLRNVYDEAGNLVRQDRNGRTKLLSYDGLNRLVSISYGDGSPSVSYTYDTGEGAHLRGRLSSVTDSSCQRYFSYDAFGHLDYEDKVVLGVSYRTEYEFDPAGNLRAMVYPTGQRIEYRADSVDAGLVGSVVLEASGSARVLASAIRYEPFGPLSGLTYGNGLKLEKGFDTSYRPVSIRCGGVMSLGFQTDGAGRVVGISNGLDDSRSQSFGYDALGRLISATGIYGSIEYTYDKTGNRLSRSHDGAREQYSYVSGTNRLAKITGPKTVLFDHDADGNVTGRTFASGQPPSGRQDADYVYSYDGQRLVKSVGGNATVYHYDHAGNLIAETTADGSLVCAYVYLEGQPLARLEAGGGIYYYHNDHLGTPQKLTDESGNIAWSADYLPFGKADVTIEAVVNNLRFPGQYFDADTGLHYNGQRYYDPGLGRYLRPDPIGLAGGINLYAYVLNDPVNSVDPEGLASYLVSWTNVGGSRKNIGGTYISGIIISLNKNRNNLHNAVSFNGHFVGVSIGFPVGGSYTRSQIFIDSYENADVSRIKGYSSFTSITSSLFGKGGISWGVYAFGDLYSVSNGFSGIEGFELSFSSMQGRITLEGDIFEVTSELLNELMGLIDPLADECK